MSSVRNLCTPKNGEIMISATQDFLTFAFIITSKDRFLTRAQMCQLLAAAGDAMDEVDLPPPSIFKPLELWTGKQLFSCLVRPNARTK
jgi:DNA-directed RNA polymerase III subunit RPC1